MRAVYGYLAMSVLAGVGIGIVLGLAATAILVWAVL